MTNNGMILIDGAKLDEELKALTKREGCKRSDLEREIGYAVGYFHNVIARGRISKVTANILDNFYNIKISTYELQPEPEPKEEEVIEVVGNDVSEIMNGIDALNDKMDELQKQIDGGLRISKADLILMKDMIYQAVYAAVKHAWEND